MPEVSFLNAKNNSLTCSVNGLFLHSKYNPEQEAERFVQNISYSFIPKYIIITEPALFYIEKYLYALFPKVSIILIRFSHDFEKHTPKSVRSFCITDSVTAAKTEDSLFSLLTEEGILSSLFLEWLPSSKAFPQESKLTWEMIKNLTQKSRTIFNTKSYFSKRWLINAINISLFTKKTALLPKTNKVVIITASGPSLTNAINLIKQNRPNLFVLAVSSSLSVLLYNKIIPDAVISTDGGYWAKKHLSELNFYKDIPLALSAEASCPKKILQNSPIIPLLYDEELPSNIVKNVFSKNKKLQFAERNGTVSGTAICLALNITNSFIIFAGLDLQNSKGLTHAKPNKIEIINELNDKKINPKEKRIACANFNSESLNLYRTWFVKNSFRFEKKLFRLTEKSNNLEPLGLIKDISAKEAEKIILKNQNNEKVDFFITKEEMQLKEREKIIKATIDSLPEEEFYKTFFPAEYLSFSRAKENDKQERKALLLERSKEFRKKLSFIT